MPTLFESGDTLTPTLEERDDILEALLLGNSDHDLAQHLKNEVSAEVISFIKQNHELSRDHCLALLKTSTAFNVKHYPACNKGEGNYDLVINLKSINDTLMINELFGEINTKLKKGGVFVSSVETYQLRKKRILKKFVPGFNWVYYCFDYLFKRVFPKLKVFDKIYFYITVGRNRALSSTETLGRLSYCGFEILGTTIEDGHMYFAAKKIEAKCGLKEKSYRIFLRLPRKGKNGKSILVYKLRTMFPYAEHIQEYVYKRNKLSEGGKFRDDFRISLVGRFFRKYFLDELPMIFNLLKGELKVVGVRPLSEQYFSLYDEKLQQQRLKHKPGLIPPYYVDLPESLEEIHESELKYLDAHEKAPFKTDVSYFFKAMGNIIFKKARSK